MLFEPRASLIVARGLRPYRLSDVSAPAVMLSRHRWPQGCRAVRAQIAKHLSGNLRGWRSSAIVFGVIFRSLPAVKDGLLSVAMRDQRLVRRVCVVLFFVVLGGLMMMSRRLLVMFCCERMVFCAWADPGHDSYLMLYASNPRAASAAQEARAKRTAALRRGQYALGC